MIYIRASLTYCVLILSAVSLLSGSASAGEEAVSRDRVVNDIEWARLHLDMVVRSKMSGLGRAALASGLVDCISRLETQLQQTDGNQIPSSQKIDALGMAGKILADGQFGSDLEILNIEGRSRAFYVRRMSMEVRISAQLLTLNAEENAPVGVVLWDLERLFMRSPLTEMTRNDRKQLAADLRGQQQRWSTLLNKPGTDASKTMGTHFDDMVAEAIYELDR